MEWLNTLLQYVGKLIPRVTYIPKYSNGVLFSGWTNKEYKVNGIVIWLPIISYLCSYPATKQARELRNQSLITNDWMPINVLVVVEYTITDPILCATSVFDYKEILDNTCKKHIKENLIQYSLDEIIESMEDIDAEIFNVIAEAMAEHGLTVHNAYLSDVTLNIPIKMWSADNDHYSSISEYE